MKNENVTFASLFKRYRLRSEIKTLTQFGNLLAEEGYIYENSLFTRWENGERYPKKRELLVAILRIFAKGGGMWCIEDANLLLESVEQRDLTSKEAMALERLFNSPVTQPLISASVRPRSARRILISLCILGLVVAVLSISLTKLIIVFKPISPQVPQRTNLEELIIGTDPTLPPMEYLKDGQLVGYDIELAYAIANELNSDVAFKEIAFKDLFIALEEGQIDLIISAVTITEDRKQKFDFSKPYLNSGQVIIVKDAANITSSEELRGKRVGAQRGTTNELEALKYTDASLVIRYQDFAQAALALVEGEVDAVFTDLPNGRGITLTHPELQILGDPSTDEYYGIVFRKNDPLSGRVDEALNRIALDGILIELQRRWID